MTSEREKPNSSDGRNDTLDTVVNLAGRILRESYGQESFPPLFDRPPRPANLDTLVESCAQAISNRYGSDSFTIKPDNVHWVSRDEFVALGERSRKLAFRDRVLMAVGAKFVLDEPLGEDKAYLRDYTTNPPNIYLSSNVLDEIGGQDFKKRPWQELELASRLLYYTVFFSSVPKDFYHEILIEELKVKLEKDRSRLPREIPSVNKELLDIAVDNFKMFLDHDETRRTVIDGARISCRCLIRNEEGLIEEDIAATGSDFEEELSEYLAFRALEDFSKSWVQTYPSQQQDAVANRFRKLLQPTPGQKFSNAATERFLKSIGLPGYKDAYQAHLYSEIPNRFVEAKKKHRKLVYPD